MRIARPALRQASRAASAALARSTPSVRRSFASSSTLQHVYGFIGLGRMGYPMAQNLRSKIPQSDTMIIYDANTPVNDQFAKEVGNVEIADNVRQVAEQAETILTVLPEPKHVENVFSQMLQAPERPGRLFIDCSTIDVKSSGHVANATASSNRGRFVDAPMSGGVVGARAGALTFMVGAADDLAPRAEAVLATMGRKIVHLGPQTSGLKGKLANNYLLALNNVATAEAMNMGVKWGLDAKVLASMINTATGRCWPSETNNPVPGVVQGAPAERDYEGGFGTSLMLKDLQLALRACAEANIVPLLGPYAKQIYTAVEAEEGTKGRDFSVVYKYLGGLDK